MGFIDVDRVSNDGREYKLGLEEIGFIKGRILKSGNEIDGVELSFAPKCELIIFSSTSKYQNKMHFVSIYFESRNYGQEQYKTITNILREKGLVGLIEYFRKINPSNCIENNNDIFTSSNKELARYFVDFV